MTTTLKNLITLVALPLWFKAQSFDRTKIGTMIPATVMYPDGRTENVNMKMQTPEQLKKLENILEIELNENNVLLKEINKSLGTKGSTGVIGHFQASLFDAFLLDGNIWAKRPNPKAKPAYAQNFVVLTRQGGIQEYTYIEGEHKEGTLMLGTAKGTVVWKWGDKLPNNNYREMISDCSDLKESLKTDLSNLDSVLTAYNLWYETQYPGRIKYHFQNGPQPFKNKSGSSETKDLKELIQKNKEKREEKELAKKEKMSKRPATVDASIASKKPNLPPKKETFSEKVKRLEQEGNRIAVIVESQKTIIRSTGGACVQGEKEKLFEDTNYVNFMAAKLNELYQTKIFEVVDVNKIPTITIKNNLNDDWWATHYKVVVTIDQTRAYNAILSSIDQKSSVQYFINNRANVTEYIDDDKKSIDYLKRAYNLGDGYSNAKNFEGCGTLEKFEEITDTQTALERLEKDEAKKWEKLVKKWD